MMVMMASLLVEVAFCSGYFLGHGIL